MSAFAARLLGRGSIYPKVAGVEAATATASSLTINKPAAVQSGMLLVGAMGVDAVAPTWTGASGWTQRAQQPTYRPGLRLATKTAGGSEPSSYTFNQSAGSAQEAGHVLAVKNGVYDTIGAWAEGVSPATLVVTGITMAKGGLLIVSIGLQVPPGIAASIDGMALVADTFNTTRVRVMTFAQRVGKGATGDRSFSITGGPLGTGGIALGVSVG